MTKHRAAFTTSLALAAALSLAGCQAETSPPPSDSERPCAPDCHWDCLSPTPFVCVNGEVWSSGRGARTCCHFGEPWPGPGPMCAIGSQPVLRCASGECGSSTGTDAAAYCAPADAAVADGESGTP